MSEQQEFQFDTRPTIKGFPELRWTGKRPYRSTVYYPAQLRESYGTPAEGGEHDGWMNKIYWGDNLQVMSHLLRDYRGQVDLIYIDPPFDSKADYKKKIKLHGQSVTNDSTSFEEKQYGDIWTNDLKRAHNFAQSVEAGMVWLNSNNVRDLRTPFGGVKASGLGHEGGYRSIDFYTEQQSVHINLGEVHNPVFGKQ